VEPLKPIVNERDFQARPWGIVGTHRAQTVAPSGKVAAWPSRISRS
jgi:hypothetical protein